MSLTSDSRLGPYEILTMLGSGGMGEVYRAHDSRLGRDVAIKVLPSEVSRDPERLRRFELEARAAASLNHPNILTVHEIGSHNGQPYVVSELLEGQTLRSVLFSGALAVKQAADYGIQIATGLAAAHEKGIVHRDVKPENIFVTSDGRIKILDFGLAKLTEPVASSTGAAAATRAIDTLPGVVFGTAGYMSPEQVRGQPVDHRTDIFAFGSVFYEMLSGRRAFKTAATAETMAAILNHEPDALSSVNPAVPRVFERVTHRCLEKQPELRFQSAKDVAFAIDAGSSWSGASPAGAASSDAVVSAPVRRQWVRVFVPSAVALFALGAIADRFLSTGAPSMPRVTRLTFERGTVSSARFTTDGKTVVYGAAWRGEPTRIFQTRLGTPESTALQLPDADLLAISAGGELATSTSRVNNQISTGTMARAPLVGGASRDVLDNIRAADWSQDGTQLAVVRHLDGRDRLEYPPGTVLYETAGFLTDLRITPRDDAIAFFHHTELSTTGGEVQVMLATGKEVKRLGPVWVNAVGLAWSPDGQEVWFTAGESAFSSDASLKAVTRDGIVRQIWSVPFGLTLHDIAPDGRALLTGTTTRNYIGWLGSEPLAAERDVSWFSLSGIADLSSDGRSLLMTRQDQGAGRDREVGLLSLDSSTAVRLGAGYGFELSPDGKWALARLLGDSTKLLILPTGAGESRQITTPGFAYMNAGWLPDGKRIVFVAKNGAEQPAAYLQDLSGGSPRRLASNVSFRRGLAAPLRVSPNGKWFTGPQSDGPPVLLPLDGGKPKYLPALTGDDRPLNWSADSSAIFVERAVSDKRWATAIVRYDLVTSQMTPVRQIEPSDVAGIRDRPWCLITADGRNVVYVINRQLNDLYVVEGLK